LHDRPEKLREAHEGRALSQAAKNRARPDQASLGAFQDPDGEIKKGRAAEKRVDVRVEGVAVLVGVTTQPGEETSGGTIDAARAGTVEDENDGLVLLGEETLKPPVEGVEAKPRGKEVARFGIDTGPCDDHVHGGRRHEERQKKNPTGVTRHGTPVSNEPRRPTGGGNGTLHQVSF
jgi:hypothetical protein